MLMKTVKLLQIRKEFDPTSCQSETIFDPLFVSKSGRSWRKVDGPRGLNGQVRRKETGRLKAVQFSVTVHFGPDSIFFYRFNSKRNVSPKNLQLPKLELLIQFFMGIIRT